MTTIGLARHDNSRPLRSVRWTQSQPAMGKRFNQSRGGPPRVSWANRVLLRAANRRNV